MHRLGFLQFPALLLCGKVLHCHLRSAVITGASDLHESKSRVVKMVFASAHFLVSIARIDESVHPWLHDCFTEYFADGTQFCECTCICMGEI